MATPSLRAAAQVVQATAIHQVHKEQLQRAELFNGRAAMLGFAIGLVVEAFTGFGILHQIGLSSLLCQG